MDDKFRARLESAVHAAAVKNLGQAVSGKKTSGFMETLEELMGGEHAVPAHALRKTDDGFVLITGPEVLLRKMAKELRSDGLIVANVVPDYAQVVRTESGGLVFSWRSNQVVDINNPPQS